MWVYVNEHVIVGDIYRVEKVDINLHEGSKVYMRNITFERNHNDS
jgi:hypothetical protein